MRMISKPLIGLMALVIALFAFTACDTGGGSSQDRESTTQQSSYDTLTKNQPAVAMSYSSTRDTINAWTKLWSQKGKVAYVYLVSGGKPYAFAVTKGLPVSYCVGLTPPYKIIKPEITGDNNVPLDVPAPSIDGAYYSGSDCNRYYAFDATTNGYFEFTAGADTTLVIKDNPYPLNQYADALPLGDTDAQGAQAVPATVDPPK